jgi:hypothetical protein
MSTVRQDRIVVPARSYWRSRRPSERACYVIGAFLVLAGVFHFGVFLVSGGPWDGPVSWRKPTTFGESFGLTLIAVTWVTSYLVLRPRTRAWLLGVFAADCVLEVTGITVQAWRHVPSHFNTGTPVNRMIAMSLAVGGAILIATLGTFAVIAFRGQTHGPRDIRLALKAGFAFLLIGLASGVAMIAKGTVLVRSGHLQQAYDTAGTLKPVHGVALHAILVLPVVAEVARWLGYDEPRRYRAVLLATGVYVAATLLAVAISVH